MKSILQNYTSLSVKKGKKKSRSCRNKQSAVVTALTWGPLWPNFSREQSSYSRTSLSLPLHLRLTVRLMAFLLSHVLSASLSHFLSVPFTVLVSQLYHTLCLFTNGVRNSIPFCAIQDKWYMLTRQQLRILHGWQVNRQWPFSGTTVLFIMHKKTCCCYGRSGVFLEGKREQLLSSLFPLFVPGALNEKRNCEAERNQKRLREIEGAHKRGTEMHPGRQVTRR